MVKTAAYTLLRIIVRPIATVVAGKMLRKSINGPLKQFPDSGLVNNQIIVIKAEQSEYPAIKNGISRLRWCLFAKNRIALEASYSTFFCADEK